MEKINFSKMTDDELKAEKTRLEAVVAKLNNYQLALKYLLNGEYGACGNQFFRFFDVRLASAITLCGQLAIKWIDDYLMSHELQKKYRWTAIYCDTDSIYLDLKYVVDRLLQKKPGLNDKQIASWLNIFCNKVIEPIIDEGYQELANYVGAPESRMVMKREKISTRALWTGKKKYALMALHDEKVVYPEPKLKVKGIETVRSSTPELVRKKLEKVLKIIMSDESQLADFIEDTRKEFYGATPEQIAFTVGVNTMSKYETTIRGIDGESELHYKKGVPIGVRAAINYNSYIIKHDLVGTLPEIREGDKIKFLYLKQPNPIKCENVIGFPKNLPARDKLLPYIDYGVQFEKTFMSPIRNITDRIRIALLTGQEVDINDLF